MSVLGANPLMMKPAPAIAADVVTKSLRLDKATNPNLYRTGGTGNRKKWTFSFWVKRAEISYSLAYIMRMDSVNTTRFEFNSSDQLFLQVNDGTVFTTTRKFRDTASFYHIVLVWDSDNSTAANRCRLYVNGEEESISHSVGSGTQSNINKASLQKFFGYGSINETFGGFVADVYMIDGTALTPTTFGETDSNNQWIPKATSGLSYGVNGFHLEFLDDTDIGKDSAANISSFSTNALASTDLVADTPTDNYCVLNPLDKGGGTLSEGNLAFVAGGAHRAVRATQAIPASSKAYFEVLLSNSYSNEPSIGIMSVPAKISDHQNATQSRFVRGNGYTYNNGSEIASGYSSWSSGDIIGIEIDSSANTFKFNINGGSWTTAFSDLSGHTWLPCLKSYDGAHKLIANFGQDPFFAGGKSSGQDTSQSEFYYTPPSGFKALSTANLPTPTIAKGGDYFNTKLYSGSGAQTGVGFQPDLVWVKSRGSALTHKLTDSVRGTTKSLSSNITNVEATTSTGLTAFGTDGFTVGADGDYSASAMVAWCWKKSTTAGFGIATYTGTGEMDGDEIAVAHGCGGTPELVIVKDRDGNYGTGFDWIVWHHKLSTDNFLRLNSSSSQSAWDSSYPLIQAGATNNTFGIDTTTSGYSLNDGSNSMNGETDYVVYSARSVAGFSQFGDYTGNGSANGPFVSCGFRPAFVMVKRKDSTGDWMIFDGQREGYNVDNDRLVANSSTTENTTDYLDILSNGFKLRSTDSNVNASSGIVISRYVFAAFAEAPFKYANAR